MAEEGIFLISKHILEQIARILKSECGARFSSAARCASRKCGKLFDHFASTVVRESKILQEHGGARVFKGI